MERQWRRTDGTAFGEIAPSLTTRLLDAVDVDLDIIVGLKFHHQAPYLALTNHMAFPAVLMASKKWWDRLPEADQVLINKVFHEAEAWGIQLQAEAEKANLEKLKNDGVTVSNISQDSFKKVGQDICDMYIKKESLIHDFYTQVKNSAQ